MQSTASGTSSSITGSGGGGGGIGTTQPTMQVIPAPSASEFARIRRGDDEDGMGDYYVSPFAGIEKSAVLQEASSSFNNPEVVRSQPQRCVSIITKLLFLLAQGERFAGNEASDVFFAVTKLFQSQDLALRRMTYLFLKEVAEATLSEEIIIVTASLTKDMNSGVDMHRANAIRVLCKIVEPNMLAQIERYLKQAIVDKDDQVAAAALLSADQMAHSDPAKKKIVSNWLPEIQSSLTQGSSRLQSVQYNALSLLYRIKSHDRLAVSKLVTQLSQGSSTLNNAPLAACLLIRFTSRLLHDDFVTAQESQFAFKFLESCLRHRSEMVVYEAARAICRLPGVTDDDVAPAVNVLVNLLKSPGTPARFAAARTLSEVAIRNPIAVSKANHALEGLIHDRNRSVATMAITTLLKTGNEASIEPLTKQIATFMSELADEFKIVVVNAIRTLTLKYKRKHRMLLSFLSSVLRDEGGYDFKRTIVESILEIMNHIPESTETALYLLSDFIEDCEFTQLSTLVLHELGQRGPKTPSAAKYIRYVYNRVILENAHVRAAAVSTLCAFGARVPQLKPNVLVLLKRCQLDDDDEVRDRATICLNLLSRNNGTVVEKVLLSPLPLDVHRLEVALTICSQQQQQVNPNVELSFATLPAVQEKEITDHQRQKGIVAPTNASTAAEEPGSLKIDGKIVTDEPLEGESSQLHTRAPASAEELKNIAPEFKSFGDLFKSSEAVELTERETEYLVRCVKHVFANHVILQFNLTNTLPDQRLTNVNVQITPVIEPGVESTWKVVHSVPVTKLPYDVTKSAYVALERASKLGGSAPPPQAFEAELVFFVHDVDPDTKEEDAEEDDMDDSTGYKETYVVNPFDLVVSDFFLRKAPVGDFKSAWELVGEAAELREQFALSFPSVPDAVKGVIDTLGMLPCENTGVIPSGGNITKHILLLSGQFVGNKRVLAHANLSAQDKSVILKIAVRSDDADVSKAVFDLISGG